MNFPPHQQQHQDAHQLPLIKQEGQSEQDSIQSFQDTIQSFQNYQSIPTYPSPQQQPQTYGGFQGSTAGNLNSFSTLPQNPYSLNNHLMGLSMQNGVSSGPASSSLAPIPSSSGLISGVNSGSTTPAMAYASAPSSPIVSSLQQFNPSGHSAHQYSQHNSSFYQQSPPPQQQQPHPNRYSYQGHTAQSMSTSSLTSSFYPTSPSQQPQQQHGSSSTSFHAMPSAPVRQQQQQQQQPQYPPLVPPLTPAQHAQYHLLLGSALSSTASTPYHSNQSTPYSSMPGSPTLDHQQLGDPNFVHKPKRRQVKNACVNCQKACKKCDEGRPCARCVKYGLTETCVDSTRKVRKKGIKRGPYKRKIPPSALGSASASTTPILSHAVLSIASGYMSEPVTALNSPTQAHMLPFTSSSSALGFGYGSSSGSTGGYSFQTQGMDNSNSSSNNNHSSYAPAYTTGYSGGSLYAAPYGMNDGVSMASSSNITPNPNTMYNPNIS